MTDVIIPNSARSAQVRAIWTAGPIPPVVDILNIVVGIPYGGVPLDVVAGRTVRLTFDVNGLSGVSVTAAPLHGNAVVNPDLSVSLVLTTVSYTGAMTLGVDLTDGSGTQAVTLNLNVLSPIQHLGWPLGLNIYMLPVNGDGTLDVQPGSAHRKVYVSPTGLTAAQIEAAESLSAGTVTANWLRDNAIGQTYGISEATALASGLGFGLFQALTPQPSSTSHWLLMQRGGTYNFDRVFRRGARGESMLAPLYIGAWGEGANPILSQAQDMIQDQVYNIVVEGVRFAGGILAVGNTNDVYRHENLILNNCEITGKEASFEFVDGLTVRNTRVFDTWLPAPLSVTDAGKWAAFSNRVSGIYTATNAGLLFDGVIFDHNGWAPDFLPDGAAEGGHPPSMYSHNLYSQFTTFDFTYKNCLSMRGASVGVQFRGGAFVLDSAFISNNVAFNFIGGNDGAGPVGNYSLSYGVLVTQAANLGGAAPSIGALDWGIRNDARGTTLIGGLVVHANDPNDPTDTVAGNNALFNHSTGPAFNDTIVWRWGGDQNAAGVDATTADATTIHAYAATLPNDGVPSEPRPPHSKDSMQALGERLRSIPHAQIGTEVQAMLDYFRAGFGVVVPPVRTEATTLYFVPDPRGDGVRWDNPLNWRLADGSPARPPRNGDTVHLRGALVVSPCDTWTGTIHLEGATLTIVGGRLSGDAVGPGTVQLVRAGQHNLDLSGGATVDDQR